MELLSILIGAFLAEVCTLIGVVIHTRWIDRKLLPPPPKPKPARPELRLLDKNGGGQP